VTLYMCSHHGHQVHVLLMMSIILVMELLQETFVEVNFASPTFFNGHHHKFTTNVQILLFFFFLHYTNIGSCVF
jgi:phosphate starvation-inducible membrane PsiE